MQPTPPHPPDAVATGAPPSVPAAAPDRAASRSSPARRYGAAAALSALALALTPLLRPILTDDIFLPSYLAVAAAAWYGGRAPGVVAAIVTAAGARVLMPAADPAPAGAGGVIPLVVLAAVAVLAGSAARPRRGGGRGGGSGGGEPVDRAAIIDAGPSGGDPADRRLVERTREAERATERIARLHAITAALARAVTAPTVAEIIVEQGVSALGAAAGAIAVVDPDGESLELIRAVGYPDELIARLRRIPLSSAMPTAEAARTGRPVFLESEADRAARYPELAALDGSKGLGACAVIPLTVDDRILGAMTLTFPAARSFDEEDRAFALALGRQCGQALERVRLFEVERAARARAVAAEAALREADHRLMLALEAGRLGPWEYEVATGRVTWSRAVEEIHGRAPGTFDGTFEAYQRDIHPEDRDRVVGAIARLLERRESEYRIEYRIVRPDGETRWLEARGRAFYDESGEPVRILGVCTDQTERKHAETVVGYLSEASSLLASTLDPEQTLVNVARLAVPMLADICVVDLVDDDGRIRRVAHAAADPEKDAILREMAERYPPDLDASPALAELLTRDETLVAPEDIEAVKAGLARNEEHRRMLDRLEPACGVVLPLAARGRAVGLMILAMAESGRSYGPDDVALARELTRRAAIAVDNARLYSEARAARIEAEAANRAKGEFLARMSHELRTPLNAIAGYCEILELGLRGPLTSQQLRDIERIKLNQRHLLKHINDILNFARIDAGHIDLRPTAVPVEETLEEVRALFEPQLRAKGLRYEHEPGDRTVCCHADAERLQQIVVNLLSNAIKFTEPGGAVSLAWETVGDEVRIHVRDTGRGIPADRLETIFDPFVQVDDGLTRTGDGTGLGLAISRELARAMGGDITVESEPGAGSTFTLALARDAGVRRADRV